MRSSRVRARLKQDLPVRIACMYYPSAMMPLHAAKAGYDAIWLDAEHSTWERRELQRLIGLHHLADIDCLGCVFKLDLYSYPLIDNAMFYDNIRSFRDPESALGADKKIDLMKSAPEVSLESASAAGHQKTIG